MYKEIKLYGEVSEWSRVSQKNLEYEMRDVTGTAKIRVHSPGGSVFEGWAIYNFVLACAKKGIRIEFYVDGIAASMMSFIVQAGHAIYMAENSMMMIHAPTGGAYGNAAKVRSAADLLDKVGKMMSEEYQKKSTADEKKVQEWMSADTWFTPQEALAAGLIDGITEAVTTRKPDKSLQPKQAFEAYALADSQTEPEMKTVISHLGLEESASEAQVLLKLKELEAATKDATDRATDAEAKLRELEANSAKEKATALVEGAVAAGKIAPGDKETYIDLATNSYESTKKLVEKMTPVKSVREQINEGPADLAKAWDEAHKNGTLERVKETEPERYQAMHEARWGKKD